MGKSNNDTKTQAAQGQPIVEDVIDIKSEFENVGINGDTVNLCIVPPHDVEIVMRPNGLLKVVSIVHLL